MPKWTAKLTVVNDTDQFLDLSSRYIHSASKVAAFPTSIKPRETASFEVYTPSGVAAGPEFAIILKSRETDKRAGYGSFNFHVDIPYWKTKNTLQFSSEGELSFDISPGKIKDSDHNYDGRVKITTKAFSNSNNKELVTE